MKWRLWNHVRCPSLRWLLCGLVCVYILTVFQLQRIVPPSTSMRSHDDSLSNGNAPKPAVRVNGVDMRHGKNGIQHHNKGITDKKRDVLGVNDCSPTKEDGKTHPGCQGKMNWMKLMWKSDPCYATYGVDGSTCSFRVYLSEVEKWCPKLKQTMRNVLAKPSNKPLIKAEPNFNLAGLLRILTEPSDPRYPYRQAYTWIKLRVTRMWPDWVKSAKNLISKNKWKPHFRKKILVHLGLLTAKSKWNLAEKAFSGGPLGELVQWSDIISTLYILGHDLTVTCEVWQLNNELSKLPNIKSQCQVKSDVDIIYTDILGNKQFKAYVGPGYSKFNCLLRLIDSFGTEPLFNDNEFMKSMKLKSPWGGNDLTSTQQFFTMFPHSPDNSFMGFVVDIPTPTGKVVPQRKMQAVVYAKRDEYLQGSRKYLDVIKEFVEVHGTISVEGGRKLKHAPPYLINHGLLKSEQLYTLLYQSKLFIGLGFPYEGPAPLEAIGSGCVFIQPRFSPAHSRANTPFFKIKPTRRQVTSQHPYLEQFVGEPYVYTIDINNHAELRRVLKKVLSQEQVKPFLPYEYSQEGMIERLNFYIENQDFCSNKEFIPKSDVRILMTDKGISCKDSCHQQGTICEPSHFRRINNVQSIEAFGVECSGAVTGRQGLIYPAYDPETHECALQNKQSLFSCVESGKNWHRVCPCRTFIPQQTALCLNCS